VKKIIKSLIYAGIVLCVVAFGAFMYRKFFAAPLRVTVPPVMRINLDLAPEKRWNSVISGMNQETITLYDQQLIPVITKLRTIIGSHVASLASSAILPDEYRRELHGIVQALRERGGRDLQNLTYENLLLLSVAYDLFMGCTAGVIVGTAHIPYLFRTMDLPYATLRKLITTIEWYKAGRHIFTTVGLPFLPTAYTGQRNGAFAIAINARREPLALPGTAIVRYLHEPINVWSVPVLVRYALQYIPDYRQAYILFKSARLITPVYVILAGTMLKEGAIFTRSSNELIAKDTLDHWRYYYPVVGQPVNPVNEKSSVIIDPVHAQTQYIVVSNVDNNSAALTADTSKKDPLLVERKRSGFGPRYRRNSALNSCCTLSGDFSPDDLFTAVLAKQPVRNILTLYATVMSPRVGICKTWVVW
jgi:hypothetical protein